MKGPTTAPQAHSKANKQWSLTNTTPSDHTAAGPTHNTHESLPNCRLSLSWTYNSNIGVRNSVRLISQDPSLHRNDTCLISQDPSLRWNAVRLISQDPSLRRNAANLSSWDSSPCRSAVGLFSEDPFLCWNTAGLFSEDPFPCRNTVGLFTQILYYVGTLPD
ncbi:hypothetical protein Taro_008725, partial [Colocasia esculenta]|nr:hypothetical protein [Colocasia esculenta]